MEAARNARAIRYEEDDHYDVISAFIKSIRGSDVDAGLYWLGRMLAAGEDARFIARRLVILASEDIGMADPTVALDRRRGGPSGGVRGPPGSPAEPGPGRHPSGQRPEVQQRRGRPGRGPGRRGGSAGRAGARPTCATPATGAPPAWGTGRATSTPTPTTAAGSEQEYRRRTSQGRAYYRPSEAWEPSRSGWRAGSRNGDGGSE